MKKSLIGLLLLAPVVLFSAGCDDKNPGKITAKYDNTTSYLYKCEKGYWALTVVPEGSNTEIANCVSEETYNKYEVGQQYP